MTEAPVKLRPGAKLMLQRLSNLGVPVLVVSAGCTDVIISFLEAQGAMHENMHVSSNSLVWDASGDVCQILPEPPGELLARFLPRHGHSRYRTTAEHFVFHTCARQLQA